MKKIILVFTLILCIFSSKAHAAEYNGFLDTPGSYTAEIKNLIVGSASSTTDNDLTTFLRIGAAGDITYTLSKEITVDRYFLSLRQDTRGSYKVELLTNDNNVVHSKTFIGDISVMINVGENITFKKLRIINTSSYAMNIFEVDFSEAPLPVHTEIENLAVSSKDKKIILNWEIPKDNSHFIGSKIYMDGSVLARLDKGMESYITNELQVGSSHEIKVTALYSDGFETSGITKNVKIEEPKPVEDVSNLKVEAKYNRVNLSWKLPQNKELKSVVIYRDTVKETSMLQNILFGSIVYAAETPIFETNGTYFNDLSVKPDTTYEYTLKTLAENGLYSDGVSITTSTPVAPIEIGDGSFEKDENGDYLFTWTSPTTGKVKVLIDGKEYKTVDAALKKILIPKENMIYDFWGNPKVTLVAISETGEEGKPTKPTDPTGGGNNGLGDMKLPFSVKDVLTSSWSLLSLFGGFILLGLIIILFKPLKNLFMQTVKSYKNRKERSKFQ